MCHAVTVLAVPPPTSPHDWAKTHKNKRQHKVGLGWQNLPALNIPYHHLLSTIHFHSCLASHQISWAQLVKTNKKEKETTRIQTSIYSPLAPNQTFFGGSTLLEVSWGIEDSDCHCQSEIGPSNNGFLVDLGHRILSFQVPLEAKIDSQVDICWILLRGVLLACGLRELHFCWISSVSWKKLAASS